MDEQVRMVICRFCQGTGRIRVRRSGRTRLCDDCSGKGIMPSDVAERRRLEIKAAWDKAMAAAANDWKAVRR